MAKINTGQISTGQFSTGQINDVEGPMRTAMVAGALGKGLVAGAIGTAVMTVSSSIEAKLTKREPSTAPADAADAALKVLGYTPSTDEAKARFSNIVHWTYGTALGAVRGVIGGAGFRGPFGTAAHLFSMPFAVETCWATSSDLLKLKYLIDRASSEKSPD